MADLAEKAQVSKRAWAALCGRCETCADSPLAPCLQGVCASVLSGLDADVLEYIVSIVVEDDHILEKEDLVDAVMPLSPGRSSYLRAPRATAVPADT